MKKYLKQSGLIGICENKKKNAWNLENSGGHIIIISMVALTIIKKNLEHIKRNEK